uniref:Tripartite motif containing 39 n=1 Tax=Podarcis muralis TaxID=64176 RepID=A0A670HZN8_PODMU
MASSSSTDVGKEATCPICMEYLTDPVTLACGHFCRDCIVKYFDTWEHIGDLECPICKARMQRGNFRPNWQLANIVEKIKLLPPNKGEKDLCKKHEEKLHLFCKEDEELVCWVCERSPEHKSHTVVLKEEAAHEYKTIICHHLKHLRKEREQILDYEANMGKESNNLLVKTEKRNTVEKFRQLHQFLEEEEKRLLNEIEEMEKEITRRREKHLAGLSEELSSLDSLIREMEEKSQQPVSELLQVRLWKSGQDVNLCLTNVILDLDTAYPRLILSRNRKSVRRRDKSQDLPKYPERFSSQPCVLGREGFTAGRHFWEVNSVRRKGIFPLSPKGGIWAVGMDDGEYSVYTSPVSSPLFLSEEPRRIRVTLDYEGGSVSFSDADSGAELHTFTGASFSGEILLPFFYLTNLTPPLQILSSPPLYFLRHKYL